MTEINDQANALLANHIAAGTHDNSEENFSVGHYNPTNSEPYTYGGTYVLQTSDYYDTGALS